MQPRNGSATSRSDGGFLNMAVSLPVTEPPGNAPIDEQRARNEGEFRKAHRAILFRVPEKGNPETANA